MQDGIVVKGSSPKPSDPLRYHVNPRSDLTKLEKGMPWRIVQDEFGKNRWIDHEGRMYQGTSYSVEPDPIARAVFIASMSHARLSKYNVSVEPYVTCPSDVLDHAKSDEVPPHEVVHREEIPGQSRSCQI